MSNRLRIQWLGGSKNILKMNMTFFVQGISEMRLPKLFELGCPDLLKIQEGLNRLIYPPRPTWSHQHCPHSWPDLWPGSSEWPSSSHSSLQIPRGHDDQRLSGLLFHRALNTVHLSFQSLRLPREPFGWNGSLSAVNRRHIKSWRSKAMLFPTAHGIRLLDAF